LKFETFFLKKSKQEKHLPSEAQNSIQSLSAFSKGSEPKAVEKTKGSPLT
jgi:hypothetical protein